MKTRSVLEENITLDLSFGYPGVPVASFAVPLMRNFRSVLSLPSLLYVFVVLEYPPMPGAQRACR